MADLPDLSGLYDATREIGISDDLDQLLDTVLEQAQDLIEFDHCALMLYDADARELSVRRVRGYGERRDAVLGLTLKVGEGLTGWAVENEEAVRVGDVSRDPRYVTGLREARSNLAVPLIVGGDVAGAINVESERLDAFTPEHEKMLTILGAQAALAILTLRARERLQGKLEQINALYRISNLASRRRDLDDILTSMLQIALEIVPGNQAAILLLDDDCILRVRAAEGYSVGVEDLAIPLGKGVTGQCAASGEIVVINDVREVEHYIPGVPGGRSEIAIPLMVKGQVIGVLDAESEEPGAFGEAELLTLSMIAQQAGAVLQTVQLHEETRRLSITDSLTGLYNRRHFVSQLEEHVRRARRYEESLALLLLDCDYLKRINDRHGHYFGDEALRLVANLLNRILRETDLVARLGGDEFAALLLKADESLALQVAERIRSELAALDLRAEDGTKIDLSVSTGIAFFPRDAEDAKSLLLRVDRALYRAKRLGRDQLALYTSDDPSDTSWTDGELTGAP